MSTRPEARKLLTPAEVAQLFRVDPKTVTRWAQAGRLTAIRTFGGHRRYFEDEIREMMKPEKLPHRPINQGQKR